jgi:hypothetical protein
VTVTNSSGCTSSCSITLTVNPLPVCSIAGNNTVCSGVATSFTASGGTSYSWSGPSGFTANTDIITNITTAGTYNVTVTNSSGCTSSCSRTLTVNPLPVCAIAGNNTVCSGVATSFTASGGTSYSWSGPSGFTANTAIITNITTAGTYNVTVTNSSGCTSSCSRTLTVNALPICSITGSNTICSGQSTSFTASGGTSYSWSGPSGFNANTAIITNITAAGTYNVTVTNSSGCTSSCSIPLTVNTSPTVTVNSPLYCSNLAAPTITATPIPAGTYNYVWTVPAGAPNPGNVASFTATAVAGTYSVVITNPTTGCTGNGSGTLTLGAPPVISQNPADITGCKSGGNSNVSFTAQSTSGSPAPTAQWQVSADNITYTNLTTELQRSQQAVALLLPNLLSFQASPIWRNSIASCLQMHAARLLLPGLTYILAGSHYCSEWSK